MFLMLIREACHVDGKTVTCFSCLLEKPVMLMGRQLHVSHAY